MNFEQKLKQDLNKQSEELDSLMSENKSLGGYLKLGFSSNMGWMMKAAYGLGVLFSIALFYTGYQFFTVHQNEQVFWGVLLILSFQAQIATKLWIYMQTNRMYISKELRLLARRNS